MKMFAKGTLTTLVEDDDRRIADYRASGWKEVEIVSVAPTTAADKKLAKAIKDACDSEPVKAKKKAASDKKVNDAINANNAASLEGDPVDDGLISEEVK